MLSWEYPPRIVGGISRHVEGLSEALIRKGVEVHVVTPEFPGSPFYEVRNGVNVHRIEVQIPAPNFHSWILLLNHFLVKKVSQLKIISSKNDLVHIHDWLTAPAGIELKHCLGGTLMSTLHSLEFRRSGGVDSPESRMVDSIEWWGTYESKLIIVCSESMKRDVVNRFKISEEKTWVIPNGIDVPKLGFMIDRDSVRSRYGVRADERLILFVGRLTSQKGCEYLIRAVPKIASKQNVRLIVIGDGWLKEGLEAEARRGGEGWRISFVGHIPDDEVFQLMKAADVLVVPSLYEPFGVVALEGMAVGTPVVVSGIDGLAEVVRHNYSGVQVYPHDPSSIAWGIERVLSDEGFRNWIISNAKKEVLDRYSWDAVAELTIDAYKRAIEGS